MDDLEDLQARVAAAQEKLRLNADAQRKYGLRLNDVVTIVEGSLARQQDEMKRLQDAAVALRLERDAIRIAETQAKSLYDAALTRLNLLQAQNEQLRNMVMTLLNVIEGRESAGALQTVLQRLESSVHEIAASPALSSEMPSSAATNLADHMAKSVPAEEEAIEADETPSTEADVPATEEAIAVPEEVAAPQPGPVPSEPAEMDVTAAEIAEAAAETASAGADEAHDENAMAEAVGDAEFEELGEDEREAGDNQGAAQPVVDPSALTVHDAAIETAGDGEMAGTEMLDAVAEDVEAEDSGSAAEDMPEDIAEMSMNGHRDIVTDADEMLANEAIAASAPKTVSEEPDVTASAKTLADDNGPQDETLVTALLDAEKALIEAGASGVANANSPVAEIIRRISLRTREFSEASGV